MNTRSIYCLGLATTMVGCGLGTLDGSGGDAGVSGVGGNGSVGGPGSGSGGGAGGHAFGGNGAGGLATGGTGSGGTGSGGNGAGGSGAGGNGAGGSGAGGSGSGGNNTGGAGGASLGALAERLHTVELQAPEGVKSGVGNWRIWGLESLEVAPVFVAPLADCGTLVGYTTGGGGGSTARVAVLDASDALVTTLDVGAGRELRGLAAEPDGHFGALLWDERGASISIKRLDLTGAATFDTPLANADNHPTDFGIGDSRLEFGGGRYGAYYHVHSDSGHEGDTLKWVDAATGAESTEWGWGCSHSMSNLLRFNAADGRFMPACVTDCFPGTDGDFGSNSRGGIYINHSAAKVMDVDGGCNGSVAGELGGAAPADSGWKMVLNAHQNPMTPGAASYNPGTMNQDIGFASIGADFTPSAVRWLTTTPGLNEADASIARYRPADDTTEQYLVGWVEKAGAASYKLGRLGAQGDFLEGPVDVTAQVGWGRRDDPFRTHVQGDVIWARFDAAGSTTLRFTRVVSGGRAACAGGR